MIDFIVNLPLVQAFHILGFTQELIEPKYILYIHPRTGEPYYLFKDQEGNFNFVNLQFVKGSTLELFIEFFSSFKSLLDNDFITSIKSKIDNSITSPTSLATSSEKEIKKMLCDCYPLTHQKLTSNNYCKNHFYQNEDESLIKVPFYNLGKLCNIVSFNEKVTYTNTNKGVSLNPTYTFSGAEVFYILPNPIDLLKTNLDKMDVPILFHPEASIDQIFTNILDKNLVLVIGNNPDTLLKALQILIYYINKCFQGIQLQLFSIGNQIDIIFINNTLPFSKLTGLIGGFNISLDKKISSDKALPDGLEAYQKCNIKYNVTLKNPSSVQFLLSIDLVTNVLDYLLDYFNLNNLTYTVVK